MYRALILLLGATHMCSAVDVQVIANKDLAVTALSSDDLSDFYLGKRKQLPGGTHAVIVTNGDQDETEQFLAQYLDLTPAAFSASWKRMIFTGRGIPPAEAKDDQDMIDRIRSTPGSIGYVAAGMPVDGVRILVVSK